MTLGIRSQAVADKITPEEYVEANEFARAFWDRLLQTYDVEHAIKEPAEANFYRCVEHYYKDGHMFLRPDQIRSERRAQLPKFYFAESNFLLRLFLWSSGLSKGFDDDRDPFLLLPSNVRRAFSKRVWDSIDSNDSRFDIANPQSAAQANEYFDTVLLSLQRANPRLLSHLKRVGSGSSQISRKRLLEAENHNEYLFKPELAQADRTSTLQQNISRPIIVDVPFFQLRLGKSEGKLRILSLSFHVDD